MSMKRALSNLDAVDNFEPLKKRQKMENLGGCNDHETSTTEPPIFKFSPTLFANPSDHTQFEKIFNIVYNCELSESLQLICKEIAEFATGKFIPCSNYKKCTNQISILSEDNYNDNNSDTLGYKWCIESNQYFCFQCMDKAKTCECCTGNDDIDCQILHFIPECNKCKFCKKTICNCTCRCRLCSYARSCDNCDFVCCEECSQIECNWMCWRPCRICRKEFCAECFVMPHGWWDECICNNCYDDTIIECDKCGLKCKLLHKSNDFLEFMNKEGDATLYWMGKCADEHCNIFICSKCDENERNGKIIICVCGIQFCDKTVHFCDTHYENQESNKVCYYSHRHVLRI